MDEMRGLCEDGSGEDCCEGKEEILGLVVLGSGDEGADDAVIAAGGLSWDD